MTIILKGCPGGPTCKDPACQCRRHKRHRLIPGSGSFPEESMTTHSSTLAWRIPWIEEPGSLQGSQRVMKSQTQLKQLSTSIILKTKIRGI